MQTIEIICPVFQEEETIGFFHTELCSVIDKMSSRYCCRILYVLDPSHDRTEAILAEICISDPRFELLVMSRRFGHQLALIAGMDHSRGDAIIMLDSDLQHPPDLIPHLVEIWTNGADIVQCVRQDCPEIGNIKRLMSRWFYTTFLRVGDVELPIGAADYRLVSRRVADLFRKQICEQNPFLRGLVSWIGFKIVYVPFTPMRRKHGKSKYSASSLINFAINGICSFSKVPLRFCIGVGCIMAGLSIASTTIQLGIYFIGHFDVPGWASLFATVSLIGGIQLFFLGVVGEYIGLIFDEVKNRPRYIIDRHYQNHRPALGRDDRSGLGRMIEKVEKRSVELPPGSQTSTDIHLLTGASAHCDIDFVVTRRRQSLFQADLMARASELSEKLRGRCVLVVGGGGSIGSATTSLLLEYGPAAVHVIDQNENYLAELVRNLRGRPQGLSNVDFRTLPVEYGSPIMERFLREAGRPYEIVLNFAALKHVRSEKDIYSILQMLDTNVVRHARFKRWLFEHGHGSIYFAVSTDKAANPTSLMGASKRVMEDLVFGLYTERTTSTTSARFANVSFSNGSLLDGFLRRLATRQPLAAPRNTRRYFISRTEAGELCLIAALLTPDKHIAFPNLDPAKELQTLESIALRLLEHFGLSPQFYEDEERARQEVESVARSGRWPLVVTPLDTSGEKSYEEFVGDGEIAVDIGMNAVRAFRHVPSRTIEHELLDRMGIVIDNPALPSDKSNIVNEVRQALATFRHVETGRNLDQRF